MSHEKYVKERLSHRLPSLLPEYLREESPAFEAFLKAYFEYLEAEVLVLKSQSDIDGFLSEDGTGSLLLEKATSHPSPDEDSSKIRQERNALNPIQDADPFKLGEYIVGKTSKSVAKIEVINGNTLYLKSISGNGFASNETVTGRVSQQTGIVSTFKENNILANNRLLDYSDIDNTTEDFLEYFQKDFMPSLDLASLKNKRLTIKNIKDLYKKKGTAESIEFLMRILYAQDATIRYPINETIHLSESGYTQQRRLRVTMDSGIPEANDRITAYDGTAIIAQAVIENVWIDDADAGLYAFEIMNNHIGTFTKDQAVTILDRDGVTTLTGKINGIISDVTTGSSTYFDHEDSGDILLESGLAAVYSGTYDGSQLNTEATHGGGALLETKTYPFGSLYTMNDKINIVGGKSDTDTTECLAVINGLIEGQISEILIETAGINYEAGDMVVFEGGEGGNAEAVIGSTGDEILLEGGSTFGHYEITTITNQTQIGGAGVKDNNGHFIIFNDNALDVYLDGILKTPTVDYTWKNDRVVFGSACSAGQLVELYTEYNRVVYEDGSSIDYDGYMNGATRVADDGRIRSILIKDGGKFKEIPKIYPGGYIYCADPSLFEKGEVVTGTTSEATGTIVRLDSENKRLLIKRLPTDTGVFAVAELITGGSSENTDTIVQTTVSSGTGAKLYCYSDTIGGVGSINIRNQGNKFDADGLVSGTSYFPMLIKTPSANLTKGLVLTGTLSGTTAEVITYNSDTHILTYTTNAGGFYDNEKVTYNISDSFQTLKSNTFDGRGLFAGEGIIEEQMVGDYGTLNAEASRVQDSKFYQSHSYVVKVGESINKWRGIVKDLLHPAGHVFFGEVALKQSINTVVSEQFRFMPTIIIHGDPTLAVPTPFSNSSRKIMFYTLSDEMNDPFTVLKEAGQPAYNTDPTTGGALSAFAMVAGVQTGEGTEFYDSMMRSRHMNVHRIKSVDVASVQTGTYSHDGIPTVLSLDWNDNGWLNGRSEMLYRKAQDGKIIQLYNPNHESLILEDGGLIEQESVPNYLRFDERIAGEVYFQGDYGERIVTEDGLDLINTEDATVLNEVQHFVSERSIELESGGIYFEDGDRIATESGQAFIQEDMSEIGITSYVPLGSTLRSLNTITGQRIFDISYYLKDETDNDDIALEDGIPNGASGYSSAGSSFLMSELSKAEGLRIQDLTSYYPNFFIPEYENQERKRTNITYSAYIKSATA
jgi:hypothetical protein